MNKKIMLALAGSAAMLAASPLLARDGHHGAGVSWSGMHGGVSWDGGHAYSGQSYGGYSYVPPPLYRAPSYAPPGYPVPYQAPPYERPSYHAETSRQNDPTSLDASAIHRDYGHGETAGSAGHRHGY